MTSNWRTSCKEWTK